MSHKICIRRTIFGERGLTWCGRNVFGWQFADIDHAINTLRREDPKDVCPKCLDFIFDVFKRHLRNEALPDRLLFKKVVESEGSPLDGNKKRLFDELVKPRLQDAIELMNMLDIPNGETTAYRNCNDEPALEYDLFVRMKL